MTMAPPPPPHDPSQRELVARLDGWEVRAFPEEGRMHLYFAPRGLLHLQLWHPKRRISVLTPSRLTMHRWEVFPVAGWKLPIASDNILRDVVEGRLGIPLPCPTALEAVQRWFLERPIREALREQEQELAAVNRMGSRPRTSRS